MLFKSADSKSQTSRNCGKGFGLTRKISEKSQKSGKMVGRWHGFEHQGWQPFLTVHFLPEQGSNWVGRKAMTTPTCLKSKDQGWFPTRCVFSALGGQGSPHDKMLYLVSNFWRPVEHLSVFLVPKGVLRCSRDVTSSKTSCLLVLSQCSSMSPLSFSFLQVTVSFCLAHVEKR